MFAFIVLLIVAGACFYFYQRLNAIEQEIRAEQAQQKVAAAAPQAPVGSAKEKPLPVVEEAETVAAPVAEPVKEEAVKVGAGADLETSIVAEVVKNPGMKQPELYKLFADINKKQLQKNCKDAGRRWSVEAGETGE